MTMIVYIAGPMTGYAEYNKSGFEIAEKYLESTYASAQIINPCVLDEQHGIVLTGKSGNEEVSPELKETIVRRSIEAVFECTHLYMLNGWENSTGACAEHAIGLWLGRNILYQQSSTDLTIDEY